MTTYNNLAGIWDRLRRRPKQEWQWFLDYVKDGDKVLDIGCGNGRLFDLLKERQVNYSGIDISDKLINVAKEKYINSSNHSQNTKYQIPNTQFLIADMRSLPFADHQFDIIFCLASFHHLTSWPDRQQTLLEIKRVLKPGGYLIMQNWNLMYPPFLFKYHLWHLLSPYSLFSLPCRQAGKSYSLNSRACQIPWKIPNQTTVERYYYSFTLRELRHLVKGAGFDICELYYDSRGEKAHWFNGKNSTLIARRGSNI